MYNSGDGHIYRYDNYLVNGGSRSVYLARNQRKEKMSAVEQHENSKKRVPGRPFKAGKGAERDPRINTAGAPPRGQSWSEAWKRCTNMTREEAIEYVGASTKIGRLLKELSPSIPIKDALIFASIVAYGREPNARMLSAIMDREEGKPAQPITGGDGKDLTVIFRDETKKADESSH